MNNFPLSQKRFSSLPSARQHKWIAIWLRRNYEDLLAHKYSEESLERLFDTYALIKSWLNEPAASTKKPTSYRKWLEFLSNCFHEHQKKSGKGLAEANFLPKVAKGDRRCRGPWKPVLSYRVALDGIRSAFNVGSILRVVDAVGFESAMLSLNTPGKENLQVRKTAMGCADWIPQKKYKNLSRALKGIKSAGYAVIGVETIPQSMSYAQFPWPAKSVVVVGNEEYGISEDVMKVCDNFVHLPMSGIKNSVNVANAFSAIAFHVHETKSV